MQLSISPPAAPAHIMEETKEAVLSDEQKSTEPKPAEDTAIPDETMRTKFLILIAATLGHLAGNGPQSALGIWIATYVKEYPAYSYARLVSSSKYRVPRLIWYSPSLQELISP